MFKDVDHVIEFDDDRAVDRTNSLINKGWQLLHVGTKLIDLTQHGQAYYNTVYVLGGSKLQYSEYQKEIEQAQAELTKPE